MDKKLLIPLVLALLLIVAGDIFNYRNVILVEDSQMAVDESLEVSQELNRLLSLMQDAETGQRGFLLTGEEEYLLPYNLAVADVGPVLSRLTEMAARQPERLERISGLRAAVAAKLAELEETIEARRSEGLAAAQRIVTTDRGKKEMDRIRAIVDSMEKAQGKRLASRLAISDRVDRRTQGFALLSIFGAILTMVLLGFMWNRVARRRAQAAETIAEQRELLHITLLSIGDAMITTDPRGRIRNMNPVAEKLTGWRSDEAHGRPLDDIFVIINEKSRQPVPSPVASCLQEGLPVELANHTMLVSRDGTERPIDDSAAPIRDAQGKIAGAVLIFRDVTQRKRLEDDLRQQAAELSEATRQKDEFLAILAHELRNPLAPIANAVALAEQAREQKAVVHAIAIIRRQSQQLSRLVDDLLNIGRINTGRMELRLEVVDVASIVVHAVEIVQPVIDQREQKLVVSDIEPGLSVYGDNARLTQIIGNLLDNASKYSDNGSTVWLEVKTEEGELAVSVRDEGIGIEISELPRVFDMFSQLDSGAMNEGLGIGLALVKRLAVLHSGSVEARSAGKGKGSEFIFRMPMSHGAIRSVAKQKEIPATSRKILVVDDNVDAAETLATLLTSNGHTVETANNGPDAIEVANRMRPEIVFLDIGMPGMNGYEVSREIRTAAWAEKVPIVALTGWDQDRNRARSRDAGFAEHLVKPVTYGRINQTLHEILDGGPRDSL